MPGKSFVAWAGTRLGQVRPGNLAQAFVKLTPLAAATRGARLDQGPQLLDPPAGIPGRFNRVTLEGFLPQVDHEGNIALPHRAGEQVPIFLIPWAHFGRTKFAWSLRRSPSGPASGDSTQYPAPACRLTGSLPHRTSFAIEALTGMDHFSVSQL